MIAQSWIRFSDEFSVYLYATVLDVVTEKVGNGLFHEILYADDLVYTSGRHSKEIYESERFVRKKKF